MELEGVLPEDVEPDIERGRGEPDVVLPEDVESDIVLPEDVESDIVVPEDWSRT